MLLKSRFPSQMVDAGIAKELPQMNSKPLVWLEGVASRYVWGGRIFDLLRHRSLDAEIRDGICRHGRSRRAENHLLLQYGFAGLRVYFCCTAQEKWFDPFGRMCLTPGLATLTAAVIYLYPSPLVCNAGSFLIGLSAAGGILQLGVSVMSEFFPRSKAKVTSIYMMMGRSQLYYPINHRIPFKHWPVVHHCWTSHLLCWPSSPPSSSLFRYYRVFDIPKNDVRLGERYFQ